MPAQSINPKANTKVLVSTALHFGDTEYKDATDLLDLFEKISFVVLAPSSIRHRTILDKGRQGEHSTSYVLYTSLLMQIFKSSVDPNEHLYDVEQVLFKIMNFRRQQKKLMIDFNLALLEENRDISVDVKLDEMRNCVNAIISKHEPKADIAEVENLQKALDEKKVELIKLIGEENAKVMGNIVADNSRTRKILAKNISSHIVAYIGDGFLKAQNSEPYSTYEIHEGKEAPNSDSELVKAANQYFNDLQDGKRILIFGDVVKHAINTFYYPSVGSTKCTLPREGIDEVVIVERTDALNQFCFSIVRHLFVLFTTFPKLKENNLICLGIIHEFTLSMFKKWDFIGLDDGYFEKCRNQYNSDNGANLKTKGDLFSMILNPIMQIIDPGVETASNAESDAHTDSSFNGEVESSDEDSGLESELTDTPPLNLAGKKQKAYTSPLRL